MHQCIYLHSSLRLKNEDENSQLKCIIYLLIDYNIRVYTSLRILFITACYPRLHVPCSQKKNTMCYLALAMYNYNLRPRRNAT